MEALSLPIFLIRCMSLSRFLLIFTILILCLAFSSCADVCEPFRCEDHVFEYPFGHKNSSCGDPALQLECDHDMPLLNISGNNYYILQPFSYRKGNQTHSLTIIDKRLQGDECPLLPSFQWQFRPSNQFHITGEHTNIAMGMDCEQGTQCEQGIQCKQEMKELFDESALKLGCNNSSLFLNLKVAPKYCNSVFQVPVKSSEISSLLSNPNQIRNKGFDISWSLSKICDDCESRKGICIYDTNTLAFRQCNATGPRKSKIAVPLGGAIGGVVVAAVVVLLFIFCLRRKSSFSSSKNLQLNDVGKSRNSRSLLKVEEFLQDYSHQVPTRYSYSQLKKITNNFANKLGEGGFGMVYKGKLQNGNLVGVKVLDQSRHCEIQFMNEIATIGRTHHVNLVHLMGYCFEDFGSALVYEYMVNGSLEKFIFVQKDKPHMLSWDQLHSVALGAARGIAYLRQECERRIVHFDIKPHNILLDADFIAKVSDFGLAKLCGRGDDHVSITATRGTPGYATPELWSRNLGPVTD